MLDDCRGRSGKFLNQLPRRVQIHQIVVGKLLPMKLLGRGNPALLARIQRRLLMRVLPIPQRNPPLRLHVQRCRQHTRRITRGIPERAVRKLNAGQPRRNRPVVTGGQGKRLLRQLPASRH